MYKLALHKDIQSEDIALLPKELQQYSGQISKKEGSHQVKCQVTKQDTKQMTNLKTIVQKLFSQMGFLANPNKNSCLIY